MLFGKWNNRNFKQLAFMSLLALLIGKFLFLTIGVNAAFLGLFALWISGNFVAWMKRHPSS